MKKIFQKYLAGLMALMMMTALLPAQYASAAKTVEDIKSQYHVTYGTEGGYTSSGFSGQIWQLQRNTDATKKYDYSLTVSLYNSKYATTVYSDIIYDSTVLKPATPTGGTVTSWSYSKMFTPGVTGAAHKTADPEDVDFRETNLDETFFQKNSVTRYTDKISDVIGESVDSKYTLLKVMLSTTLSAQFFSDFPEENWDSVRKNPDNATFYEFKPPANQPYTVFTAYFKFMTGKTEADVNPDTFKFLADTSEEFLGSGSFVYTKTNLFANADTDTYLIGFPKPAAANQTVKFTKIQNSSSSPLGAKIYLFTDAAKTQPVTVDGKDYIETIADGSATVSLPGNAQYWYTVKADNHADYPGTFTVPEAAGYNVPAITMTAESERTAAVTITVIDADTSRALKDVELTLDGAASAETTKTDANGQFTKALTLNSHSVAAKLAGYKMYDPANKTTISSQNFSVRESGGNNISVQMVPDRISVALPTVTGNKGEVSNASIVVKKVSEEDTAAWADGSGVKNYASGATAQLPNNTRYSMTISAAGCTPQVVYVDITNGVTTYYSDENFTATTTLGSSVTLTQLSDPYYSVDIKKQADGVTYIATVKLHNIPQAVSGTFGLQYDKEVFDYKTCVLSNDIKVHGDLEASSDLKAEVTNTDSEIVGYHVFSWQGKQVDGNTGQTYVEAPADGVLIATMTFERKANKSDKDITSNAFTVMPFDKTAEGYRVLNSTENLELDDAWYALNSLWRYCDADNEGDDPDNMSVPGRIHKSKSLLNGFYQVYPLIADYSSAEPIMYDVITNITTDFDAEKGSLTFIITDEETGEALPNAKVYLYDKDGNALTTLTTDTAGMVNYPVKSNSEETFKYWVEKEGYWNEPDDLSPATMTTVKVPVKTTANEFIEMEKKIYHKANLYDNTDHLIPATEVKLSQDTAYNNRDFRFTLVPAPGKKLKKPIKDITFQVALDRAGINYVTLPSSSYDAATNTWIVKGTDITGNPNKPLDLDSILGYKSHDIKIKIADNLSEVIEVDDTTRQVTANAGSNGGVVYTADETQNEIVDDTDGGGITVTEVDRTNPPAGVTNKTNITVAKIPPTETKKLGKFTFTADTGFVVEHVYVNGVDISDQHKGKTTFDYTFEDLTVDNDITVTFYNGTTPSEDTVMTLVVGYNGKADVSVPTAVNNITNTRRVFLNPSGLEFTVTPDTGYVLHQVRKSVDGKAPVTVSGSGSQYTVAKPDTANHEKQIVVYVNFKLDDPSVTEPTDIMVTAYIKSGEGVIAPTGIFPWNKSADFKIKMTPAKKAGTGEPASMNGNDWLAYAVDVNGTEYVNPNQDKKQPYEYTVTNILTDTKVGAVFTETAYKVTGHVDLSQASSIALNTILTGAKVKCERIDPTTGDVNMTLPEVVTTGSRADSTFTVEMPAGVWNITVSKQGYVTYQITGFEVGGNDENITFGLKEGSTTPKKITPYIGNATGNGKAVSLLDFAIISNGLRANANETIKSQGDVNDDGVNDINDVTYEKKNYGRRASTRDYTTWLNATN